MKSKKRDKVRRAGFPDDATSGDESANQNTIENSKQMNMDDSDAVTVGYGTAGHGTVGHETSGHETAGHLTNGHVTPVGHVESGKRTKLFWIFDYALMKPVQTVCGSLWRPISFMANFIISFFMDLFFTRARLEKT